MFKTNALDSVANAYVDRAGVTPGTRIEANDQNIKQQELVNSVESSGQTLDASGVFTNNVQLARAMAIYGAGGAAYHIDTGVANSYVLNPVSAKEAVPAYYDGFTLDFIPSVTNTTASTANINGIGSVAITLSDSSALVGGEIQAGLMTKIMYKSSAARFFLIPTKIILNIEEKTTSGNYAKPANLIFAIVEICGGGGGSGGCPSTSSNQISYSFGGGGGGHTMKVYANADLSASEAYVIGAAGAAGSSGLNDGGDGGTTTFKGLTASGGIGGDSFAATATFYENSGADGGVGSGGDIDRVGEGSGTVSGCGGWSSALRYSHSNGGSSQLGTGGKARLNNANAGTGYGAGAAGFSNDFSESAAAGAAGTAGVCIITEFLGV